MKLILASNSPRRRELLAELAVGFRAEPSRYRERVLHLPPEDVARALAEGKAREVFSRFPEHFVLGADTVVCFNGKILGKPKSEEEAFQTLSLLNGNTHDVITGVCLIGKDYFKCVAEKTEVTFRNLTEKELRDYVAGGSPMDKAGAYGIQDGVTVKTYEGSYSNVVGLPLKTVKDLLREAGLC